MSPFQIKILLHIFTRTTDYDGPENALAIDEITQGFYKDDLIQKAPERWTQQFTMTERGSAYVEAITSIPYPICVWTIPEKPTP